jgi:hypothetical protein
MVKGRCTFITVISCGKSGSLEFCIERGKTLCQFSARRPWSVVQPGNQHGRPVSTETPAALALFELDIEHKL